MNESFLEKIADAKCVIFHAFARYMDLAGEDEQLRIADALRKDSANAKKSLQWTIPLAFAALMYLAFFLGSSPLSPSQAAISHSEILFGKNGLALLSSSGNLH